MGVEVETIRPGDGKLYMYYSYHSMPEVAFLLFI